MQKVHLISFGDMAEHYSNTLNKIGRGSEIIFGGCENLYNFTEEGKNFFFFFFIFF